MGSFSRLWRFTMINPFIGMQEIQELKDSGKFNYIVVYPVLNNKLEITPFFDRSKAFRETVKVSESGQWVYMIELRDDHILAYLTGYCSKR